MRTKLEKLELERYPLELQKLSPEEGDGWVARIPLLGRLLFKGHGETKEEAIKSLYETAESIFAEYETRGLKLPLPSESRADYSGKLVLRLPKYLHQRLSEEAETDGVSLNTYLISLLSDSTRSPRTIKHMANLDAQLNAANISLRSLVSYQKETSYLLQSMKLEPEWSTAYSKQRKVAA